MICSFPYIAVVEVDFSFCNFVTILEVEVLYASSKFLVMESIQYFLSSPYIVVVVVGLSFLEIEFLRNSGEILRMDFESSYGNK